MRHSLTRALAVGALLGLAACSPTTAPDRAVELDEPFWLEVNQRAILPGEQTSLRFIGALEDSRCPTNALILCVWAGNARLRFAAAPILADELPFDLNSLQGPSSQVIGSHRVTLLEVAPGARIDPPIGPREYRARLVVSAVP